MDHTIADTEIELLRRAIALAATARTKGNHPFGALLADADGRVIAEAENTVVTDRDVTGHAETNLVRIASHRFSPEVLSGATLYTSTEPCAMCSGAIFWAGISRVVYGLSESALDDMITADADGPALALPAHEVLNAGNRHVEVIGPLLVDEAADVHAGFWEAENSL
jgi:tRNA(Arg) A34 adenosine deaminase TadA